MKLKKLPKIGIPLIITEKINRKTDKTEIIIRTEEEINQYKKAVGYRKARIKRYGKVPAKKAR